MNKKYSIAIVFFTGISVIGLEIASARLVSPYFGSTIYVWGGSIATALGALALGYWLGGKVIDRYTKKIVVGIALSVAGISAVIIPWISTFVLSGFQHWTKVYSIPVAVAVMVSMAVLFMIPLISMGMVSPMILRLSLRDLNTAGSWSGLLSGASTVGSIVGTFLSAFATIPLIGTRATIVGSGVLLLLLAAPFFRPRFSVGAALLVVATCAISLPAPLISRPGLLWSKESPYQLVQVATDGKKRYLYHDTASGAQSIYIPGSAFSDTLYDAFGLLPYIVDTVSTRRSVLVIGLAGASSVRPYVQALGDQFDFFITGVEIDPQVTVAAKKYFDQDQLDITVINDDARNFLASDTEKYDIIIVDAYTNELVIPPMLATVEFYQQVRSRLAVGGVVGINAASLPFSRYYPKLVNTVASVFPDVRQAPFRPEALNNFILAGSSIQLGRIPETLLPEIDAYRDHIIPSMTRVVARGPVYTDDRTDLDIRVRPFIE